MEPIQRIMIRTEVSGQTFSADRSMEHAALRYSVHGTAVNAKPDDAIRRTSAQWAAAKGSRSATKLKKARNAARGLDITRARCAPADRGRKCEQGDRAPVLNC